jgi:hypothetical protein
VKRSLERICQQLENFPRDCCQECQMWNLSSQQFLQHDTNILVETSETRCTSVDQDEEDNGSKGKSKALEANSESSQETENKGKGNKSKKKKNRKAGKKR